MTDGTAATGRVRYDPTFNLGNILTLVGGAVTAISMGATVIFAWANLSANQTATTEIMDTRLANVEKAVSQLSSTVATVNALTNVQGVNSQRITTLEGVIKDQQNTNASILDKLSTIQQDIAAIKATNWMHQ